MRIIAKKALRDFWGQHPKTRKELENWHTTTEMAAWSTTADVKGTFGHRVDFVKSNKGSALTVFDASNNLCRLITAIHYLKNYPIKGRVYILRALTHQEYDLEDWKDEL